MNVTAKWNSLADADEKVEWLKTQLDNFIDFYNLNVERTNRELYQLKAELQEMKRPEKTLAD